MTSSKILEAQSGGILRIVAAGSVDDGKSTLIGRLLFDSHAILTDQIDALKRASQRRGQDEIDLALLTDGLIDEREQGITIDVAYRYFATLKRKIIIADVPGHEQYTRNMATGASTADLAVIVVDVRKGMSQQFCRHLFLLNLLGVRTVFVAINKMDLVDFSCVPFESLNNEITKFAKKIGLNRVHIFPISAKQGDNVVTRSENMPWYGGPPLLELLDSAPLQGNNNSTSFRFPVQSVCRHQTSDHIDFRAYMGQIKAGTIKGGDEVVVLPSGHRTRVKEIITFDGHLEVASAPQSVSLTLEDDLDISRGSLIVLAKDAPQVTNELNAFLFWMSGKELNIRKKYLVKHCTRTVRAKVTRLHFKLNVESLEKENSHTLRMNDIGRATLKFQEAIACDLYTTNRATGSFIMIDEDTNETIAGGVICS